LISCFLSMVVCAQGITIKGHVTDQAKEPIIGASVVVKGSSNGTTTDLDGNFNLTVPDKNAMIVISYVGYKKMELAASNVRDVVLQDESKAIDELVVIGYGQVRKSDATGSILSVKPDQLNKGNQVTAQDALIGKIAGVQVTSSSGAPGSGSTIRVRMGSSLSASNDPLVVIDGVPVDNSSINGTSNIIGSINPADIESFTVLKDASSTAIYGSRASNGVIIITTKKGASYSTPRFNYSASFSLSTKTKTVDVLSTDEFKTTFEAKANPATDFTLGSASTDWQDEIYRNAAGQDHNFSVMGSFHGIPYRASIGYTNQNGIIITNNYARYNGGFGISPTLLNKHLTININVKASYEKNKEVSGSVTNDAIFFDPTRPVHETYDNNVGLGYYTWMTGGVPIAIAPNNPVAELKLSDNKNKVKRSIGNLMIDYKVHGFEALRFNLNLGYDVLHSDYDNHVPQYAPSMYISNQKDGTGLAYTSTQKKHNYLLDLYADYNKKFGLHALDVMAGYGWQHFWKKFNSETNDTEGKQLISPSHSESEYYLLSYYGRINYSFNDRYLLTTTLRADASSRFSSDNRWGYFPSVALAWRINNEKFLQNVESLSNLKLRLSYGKTGQQDIGSDYPYQSTYTASYNESRYKFGDTWLTTYRPDGYDPNIKWETTTTYNVGLDWGVLNNRISGSIDYYHRKTKDLLNTIYVPAGSNYTNMITTNIGSMKNDGIEFALNAIPVKTKDLEWSVNANFTWNKSKITKLNTIDTDANYVKTGNAGGTGKYLQIHKVGETPYTFFLLRQAYDDNGNPLDGKYLDAKGNITTSEEDANKYVTGKSSLAPYFYGLSTKLLYKNWDLGINGHGSIKNYVYNYVAASDSYDDLYSSQGTSGNILCSTLKTNFTQQRLYTDYFLENASFFRIDNITLGYTFSKLWNTQSNLRLSFAVQNVCTFTGYSGVDPEIYSGIDTNTYQHPREYILSLNMNF
jgi:TonB-linked SusC/RagA family outer membrane protein